MFGNNFFGKNNCDCLWIIILIILISCCCGNNGDVCPGNNSGCC